ncbi:bromodomain-containing protein 8-like, partial [Gigantopelta aegis]|uniref:bromodomain-containing protein 8-like n=1 Tax=Gigantopelta aegis TaxID=1735272 RepID=UPI001B888F6B
LIYLFLTEVKLKTVHLDAWSNKEKLALACSVLKSGDQNWVSVSRAIRPCGELDRPAEWFSQKNCALQYSDLLEKVETPKRKRGDDGVVETPSIQIVRKLTIERIEELKKQVVEEQQKYKKLKKDVEYIKSGQWDDKLIEVWDKVQAEKRASEDAVKEPEKKEPEDTTAAARADQLASIRGRKLQIPSNPLLVSQTFKTEVEESTQETTIGLSIQDVIKEEEVSSSPMLTVSSTATTEQKPKHPPTSPLLSSLLQSKFKTADSLQQLKNEAEQAEQALSQQLSNQQAAALEALANQQKEQSVPPQVHVSVAPPVTSQPELLPTSPSCAAPTLSKLLNIQAAQKPPVTPITSPTTTPVISPAKLPLLVTDDAVGMDLDEKPVIEDVHVEVVSTEEPEAMKQPELHISPHKEAVDVSSVKEEVKVETEEKTPELTPLEGEQKEEADKESGDEEVEGPSFYSVDEEVSIKEEPPSPASSVSSKVSETGGKLHIRPRKKKGRSSHRKISRVTRRSVVEDDRKDDASSKHSETDLTDEETVESDDALGIGTPIPAMHSLPCESIPNSPASLSMCSDSEDEKAFKMWKKSIMLVWRSAATHKYASVFLHPVSNDIAPGYNTVVHRSMDLGTIKKNIESGIIRTTSEFQRDMMLMFTNAIMYNSSNHNVFRLAMEMYDDVMEHIKQYVSTQLMVQTTDTKNLRQSRRSEAQEDEAKKRRPSQDPPQDGGKSKKRKTRGDDT